MPTPPRLSRDPVPGGHVRRRDPVVALTTLLLGLVIACLLVLAVLVVTTYGITGMGSSAPDMISASLVAPFAMVTAIVFFATLLLNVVAATARHFRTGH